MDHIVFVGEDSKELRHVTNGKRTMIVRGDSAVDAVHRRVRSGDTLPFTIASDQTARVRATVTKVQHSPALKRGAALALLQEHQPWARLTEKELMRWAGSRYLTFMTVDNVQQISPFRVPGSEHRKEGDWLLVDDMRTLAGPRRESPWLAGKRIPKDRPGYQAPRARNQVYR
jgi:hypothetical protein